MVRSKFLRTSSPAPIIDPMVTRFSKDPVQKSPTKCSISPSTSEDPIARRQTNRSWNPKTKILFSRKPRKNVTPNMCSSTTNRLGPSPEARTRQKAKLLCYRRRNRWSTILARCRWTLTITTTASTRDSSGNIQGTRCCRRITRTWCTNHREPIKVLWLSTKSKYT